MSVNSKMTAIAEPIRMLTGKTNKLGMDAMASDLGNVVGEVDTQATLVQQLKSAISENVSKTTSEVDTQSSLIQQIKTALEDKAAGVQLPTLNNPGGAEDLAEGKEMLDGEGKVITGTYTPPSISVANGVLTIR